MGLQMRGRYIGRFGIWKINQFLFAYISSIKYESFTMGARMFLEDYKHFEQRGESTNQMSQRKESKIPRNTRQDSWVVVSTHRN